MKFCDAKQRKRRRRGHDTSQADVYTTQSKVQSDRLTEEVPIRNLTARANFVYGLVFLASAALIARLGYVQLVQGAQMRGKASTTMLSQMPVLPARGWIYDANGNILAYDKPSFSIYLTRVPNQKSNDVQLAAMLAPVLNEPKAKLLTDLRANPDLQDVRIFSDANNRQLSYVEERKSDLPGINVIEEAKRVYPHGDLAGHILGFVGPITAETYGYYRKQQYLPTQIVGRSGLEVEYEHHLQGSVGYQEVETNNQGTPLHVMGYNPSPVPGDNLFLTLDGRLQAQTQNLLMRAVRQSKYRNIISDAEAVVLDVNTGGVLSLVSYPYYDPNWYTGGDYSKHANYLNTSGAQVNHAIQSVRYPGSTVKPANLIAALVHGAITPNTIIYGSPTVRIGTATLSNNGENNGNVNPVQAIAVSSDTYFYEVGLRMGKWFGSSSYNGGGYTGHSNYQDWLDTDFAQGVNHLFQGEWDFGLGPTTGIDLPGESAGVYYIEDAMKSYVRVPYELKTATAEFARHGRYRNYGSPVDLAFAGIGQSQEFTPLQLAQYTATIANGGKRLQPHLVDKMVAPSGKVVFKAKPVVENTVKAKPLYFKLAQEGMFGAINNPLGTAYGVFTNAPYTAAGKTGTAQISINGQAVDNSVFICYAPYKNPQVAVAVMVPGAGYGAGTAAPVARQILDEYFKEHHQFFPKNQWVSAQIPPNWAKSPAYTVPENAK